MKSAVVIEIVVPRKVKDLTLDDGIQTRFKLMALEFFRHCNLG